MTAPVKLISIHRPAKITDKLLLASSPRKVGFERPTPERPLIISASELRDFLRCRVMHHWRHQVRLETVEGKTNLALGSMVANGQEEWYKIPPAKRSVKAMERIATKLTAVQPTDVLSTENLELIKAMLIGFAAYAKDDDPTIGLVEATPEDEFDLPLIADGSIRVRGRIDVSFKPTIYKKTMSFIESKTAKSMKTDVVELNLQLSVYFWAMRKKYPKIKSFIGYYQQLRKQMPTSRVTAPLFGRDAVERDEEQIDQWVRDTQAIALDMLDGAVYANPMDSCAWGCDYKGPCLLRGTPDLLDVLKTEYKIKESKP
jgi:hypothetical protein